MGKKQGTLKQDVDLLSELHRLAKACSLAQFDKSFLDLGSRAPSQRKDAFMLADILL